jgi:RNA polymerase sigma factor (sigma-70 family)
MERGATVLATGRIGKMPVKELERPAIKPERMRSDRELVAGCRHGREEDWNLLIEKYKNLIFSIPIRYGLTREEAADIFQSVCLDLIKELSRIKDPQALPKWLMQVTAHKCFHWKRLQGRNVSRDDEDVNIPEESIPAEAELLLHEVQQEQALREVMSLLPPRCRELIHMLFYEEPRRPYQEVAANLGLAAGSIGLLRQKCLDRMKKRLRSLGFS